MRVLLPLICCVRTSEVFANVLLFTNPLVKFGTVQSLLRASIAGCRCWSISCQIVCFVVSHNSVETSHQSKDNINRWHQGFWGFLSSLIYNWLYEYIKIFLPLYQRLRLFCTPRDWMMSHFGDWPWIKRQIKFLLWNRQWIKLLLVRMYRINLVVLRFIEGNCHHIVTTPHYYYWVCDYSDDCPICIWMWVPIIIQVDTVYRESGLRFDDKINGGRFRIIYIAAVGVLDTVYYSGNT